MTKRLISLIVAMLMLLAVFTSCGDEGDAIDETVNEASRYTSSMNMWIITESELVEKASRLLADGYDPDNFVGDKLKERTEEEKAVVNALSEQQKLAWEQLDDISEALNKITKKEFKTQVHLRCMTEDGYYEAIEAAFKDHEKALADAKKEGSSLNSENQKEETVLNEYGIPELKYPKAYDFQVDILFLGDITKYREYADNEKIVALDDMIENSAVKLSYYVTQQLMKSASYNGAIYGVPNNHTLGEYTYLAVDEKLANNYLTTPEKLGNSIFSNESYRFLEYVYEASAGIADPNEKVYPIYSETGKVDLNMLHYWSYDPDSANETYIQSPETFSLFGGFYTSDSVQGSLIRCSNLLSDQTYSVNLQRKLYYENTENYITTDPTHKAAIRVVKGDYTKRAELETQGYKVLTAELPRITDEDVFSSMFAVGAHTRDEERAMEIITYLNTNAQMRNLLQYGIEGVNYTLENATDKEGNTLGVYAEATPNNTYVMDIAKTGNMFIAYPNAEESNAAEGKYGITAWEIGKQQNLEALAYPTVGLYFNTFEYEPNKAGYKVDDESVRILNAVSAKVKTNILDVMTSAAEVQAMYDEVSMISADHERMAQYLLDKIGEPVTYTMPGQSAPVQVTSYKLMLALLGMNTGYNIETTREGTLQSTNVLYQEWRDSNGYATTTE